MMGFVDDAGASGWSLLTRHLRPVAFPLLARERSLLALVIKLSVPDLLFRTWLTDDDC